MSELRTSNPLALHFLMSEDIYHVDEHQAPGEVITGAPAATEPKEAVTFDYLGENNRYILLLVNSPDKKIIGPKELEALQSILQAKKMDLKDVAVLNPAHYPGVTYRQLKDYFACNVLVMFGISSGQLNMPDFPVNVLSAHEGIKVLVSYNFSEMLGNVDKKREFWNEMKKV